MKTEQDRRIERAARAADVISRAQAAGPITNAGVDRLDPVQGDRPSSGGDLGSIVGCDIL